MTLHKTIQAVTDRIRARSETTRGDYLDRMAAAAAEGPRRAHLTCGNQAHAYAPMGEDKGTLAATQAANIGIITAYNDMLSAHQPFEHYPDLIRKTARKNGGTAQVAGGVPAMCDGVTQGIKDLNVLHEVPVIFCVLTDNNLQQSIDRSGGVHGNKGVEAAITAIKMAHLSHTL